jgi:hypothetical protein
MLYRYKQGDKIGEYVVIQRLGQGGMGEVYRVARTEDIQAADFGDEVEEFAAKVCLSDEIEERRRFAREVLNSAVALGACRLQRSYYASENVLKLLLDHRE